MHHRPWAERPLLPQLGPLGMAGWRHVEHVLMEQLIVEDKPVRHRPELAEAWMTPGVIGREPSAKQRGTGSPVSSLDQAARGFLLARHVPDPTAERDLIWILRLGERAQHDVKPRLACVRVPVSEVNRVCGPAAKHESRHALVFFSA